MARVIIPETPWTDLPSVAQLLASCEQAPPRQRYARGILGANDGELIYDDDRVKALNAIWRAERDRLFEIARRTDRYSDFEAHCRLSVQSVLATLSDHPSRFGRGEVEQLEMEEVA